MSPHVAEIHLVCRGRTNVSNETAEGFDSGWWVIAERHVQPGVRLALHEEKHLPSYLQGEITRLLEVSEERGERRIRVRVRATPEPLPWRGGGSGERGYLWEGADFGDLPVVPAVVDPRLAGGNAAVKSLLEAERYRYPLRTDVEDRARKGATGRGRGRQERFILVLTRLAAVLDGRSVPCAFVDDAGMPYGFDAGAVGMAVAAGILQPVAAGIGGRVHEVQLTGRFRAGRQGLMEQLRQVEDARRRRESGPAGRQADMPAAHGEVPGSANVVARDPAIADPFDGFDLASVPPEDFRRAVAAPRLLREDQGSFRRRLLDAYGGRCVVTGCRVQAVLEAAHIIPHSLAGSRGMDACNGLLLRSDLHDLFDAQLLGLWPEGDGLVLVLSPELAGTSYGKLDGRMLRLPPDPTLRPSRQALAIRMRVLPVR
jgi:hypothetical protein